MKTSYAVQTGDIMYFSGGKDPNGARLPDTMGDVRRLNSMEHPEIPGYGARVGRGRGWSDFPHASATPVGNNNWLWESFDEGLVAIWTGKDGSPPPGWDGYEAITGELKGLRKIFPSSMAYFESKKDPAILEALYGQFQEINERIDRLQKCGALTKNEAQHFRKLLQETEHIIRHPTGLEIAEREWAEARGFGISWKRELPPPENAHDVIKQAIEKLETAAHSVPEYYTNSPLGRDNALQTLSKQAKEINTTINALHHQKAITRNEATYFHEQLREAEWNIGHPEREFLRDPLLAAIVNGETPPPGWKGSDALRTEISNLQDYLLHHKDIGETEREALIGNVRNEIDTLRTHGNINKNDAINFRTALAKAERVR